MHRMPFGGSTMTRTGQPADPDVTLIETEAGEVTLQIDGRQAMQAWECGLMWESADLLCSYGSRFLEVGLGLGLSALRIARDPRTTRHTVVEKYPKVVDLFRARHPELPGTLEIVVADFFDYAGTLEPSSLDGIFFDPAIPGDVASDEALWDRVMPSAVRALRHGGAFVPFFSTRPVLRWPFYKFFSHCIVKRLPFTAYATTDYTFGTEGDAYIQCFIKHAE
jgi:SAM-dependent methyltransferase